MTATIKEVRQIIKEVYDKYKDSYYGGTCDDAILESKARLADDRFISPLVDYAIRELHQELKRFSRSKFVPTNISTKTESYVEEDQYEDDKGDLEDHINKIYSFIEVNHRMYTNKTLINSTPNEILTQAEMYRKTGTTEIKRYFALKGIYEEVIQKLNPDTSCAVVFTKEEFEVLCDKYNKKANESEVDIKEIQYA